MTSNGVSKIYEASSKLAKFPFEPYWPEKLKICITGAGGFIARLVEWECTFLNAKLAMEPWDILVAVVRHVASLTGIALFIAAILPRD